MERETRNIQDERARTLYVRLPHTIRNADEIRELFVGDVRVKMTRQSSRSCHVVFSDPEEKLKAMKTVRSKKIDGKRVVAFNPKPKPLEKKIKQKKIVVPKPVAQPKVTQILFVSNIKNGTKAQDLKEAFPGNKSVTLLEPNKKNLRCAFVKMESLEKAAELIRKDLEWPTVKGNKLFIKADTRKAKKDSKRSSKKLKVWDGEHEVPAERGQTTKHQETEDSEDDDDDDDDDESDEKKSDQDEQVTESEEE